ncbi:MAG: ribosomal L7Ae/L30e/S12e/Gadd45 family protein [Clostridia bacterium]|nr:ribosomal L7Ae/L30e/S12e/Gadd45 family protein [Clostridia bacterium]
MLSTLSGANKVVGAKQVLRAIQAGGVTRVFIAQDADMFVTRPVFDACRAAGIEIVEVPSMKALGEACGVQVKAAAAAVRR